MRDVYEWMLQTLLDGWLEVAKFPSSRGGYTRICISVNAAWYQEFCQSYTRARRGRFRRPRTFIKRQCTIEALRRMIGGNTSGVYAERLEAMAASIVRESRY